MRSYRLISVVLLAGLAVLSSLSVHAQRSFRDHNATMASFQPSLITPLVSPDPRLIQYVRVSVSHEYTSTGYETVNYGNGKGGGIIAGTRFEFDVLPTPYIQHNSSADNGFGDTSANVKYRIASGDAEHGNFDVAAILGHCFATGSHKNGASTDSYAPAIIAGYALRRRFDVISSLGGTLPTGKIYLQGRSVAWNALGQVHATPHIWFELENNATLYLGGSHDGKVQNFLTPAAFYVVRRKAWKSRHPFMIVDCGMQIATSDYHAYNHNLITEARVLF